MTVVGKQHTLGFYTRNVNVIASLYRNINNIALGTGHHGYCRVRGLEDLGCVAMKSQHKANNTLMIPATHCQLIGGQFIPCWQRLIPLRPENHVKNY